MPSESKGALPHLPGPQRGRAPGRRSGRPCSLLLLVGTQCKRVQQNHEQMGISMTACV